VRRVIEYRLEDFKANLIENRFRNLFIDAMTVSFARKETSNGIVYNVNCAYRSGTKNVNDAQAFLITTDINTKKLNPKIYFNKFLAEVVRYSISNKLYQSILKTI
jgi:hypothetical protein